MKSIQELKDMGYNLLAYSSGQPNQVKSFLATHPRRGKVHGYWNHAKQQYDINPA